MTSPAAAPVKFPCCSIHWTAATQHDPIECLLAQRDALRGQVRTAESRGWRRGIERAIKRVDEQVKFDEKYRLGDREKLRSGWSGIESGSCCKKCSMTKKRPPKNPLQIFTGCWNPFQLAECCECHLPFRKVAGESIHQKMVELLKDFRRLAAEEPQDG